MPTFTACFINTITYLVKTNLVTYMLPVLQIQFFSIRYVSRHTFFLRTLQLWFIRTCTSFQHLSSPKKPTEFKDYYFFILPRFEIVQFFVRYKNFQSSERGPSQLLSAYSCPLNFGCLVWCFIFYFVHGEPYFLTEICKCWA